MSEREDDPSEYLFWGTVIIAIAVGSMTEAGYGWLVFGGGLILSGLVIAWKSK